MKKQIGTRERKARINVRKLREGQGWLQWEAAEKLGVSREHLSSIETGRRGISMRMMDAIIRVFGVQYEDFFK